MEGTLSTHISNEGGVAAAQAGSQSCVWGEGGYVLQKECVSGEGRCRPARFDAGVRWTQNPTAHCTQYNSTKAVPHHCIFMKIKINRQSAKSSSKGIYLVRRPRAVGIHEKVREHAPGDGRASCPHESR
jgi:hypothetical protein